MRKTVLLALAIALVPACLFAVDGQVLINQSTVMAGGGFPYRISLPGSYKLSGNLTMTTTVGGNIGGIDVAIAIASSQVTLDLNGFTIFIINNFAFPSHQYYAIAELGSFSQITIRNGSIVATSASLLNTGLVGPTSIYLQTSTINRIEGVTFRFDDNTIHAANGLLAGKGSIVRDVVAPENNSFIICPSILFQTLGVRPDDFKSNPLECLQMLATTVNQFK